MPTAEEALTAELPSPLKVLVLDIETAPAKVYTWGLFNQNHNIGQVIEPGYVLCWGARWHGENKGIFASLYHDGREQMIRRMHELMCEADAIVTYNGKRFDLKHLHREMVLLGLTPPSPHFDIDLYQTVKQRFAFESNKLQYVSEQLGIGSKMKHQGFDLWRDIIERDDPKAWRTMRRYCEQDVKLTEVLYVRLLPWIKTHPHIGLVTDVHDSRCGKCGSKQLVRKGFQMTLVRRYQRFLCTDCGSWSRGQHQDRGIGVRPT
jgi:DNA polymerase elongation subunit (family B)